MAIQQHHIKTISIKHSGGFMEYYGCIPHKHHRSIGHQNTMDNGMIRAQALWESFSNPSSGTAFQFAGLLILFSIRRLCGLKLSRRHVFRNLLRGFARKIVHKWCYTWIFDCVYNFYYLSAFAAAFTARLWHTPFAELSRSFRAWRFCFRGGFPTLWIRMQTPFMEVFDATQMKNVRKRRTNRLFCMEVCIQTLLTHR